MISLEKEYELIIQTPKSKTEWLFIRRLYQINESKVRLDDPFNYSFDHYFDNPNTRLCLLRNLKTDECDYLGFFTVSDVMLDLSATIHGMIRNLDNDFKPTTKYYYIFQNNKLFATILKYIFENYDIKVLNCYIPEFLVTIKADYKSPKGKINGATHRILARNGFHRIYQKVPFCYKKNEKPIGMFQYFMKRNWFFRNFDKLNNKVERTLITNGRS